MNLKSANSLEFNENARNAVIALMDEQQNITRKGGTMRLGSQPCKIKGGTLAAKLYGAPRIMERHRHRYEFNNKFRERYEAGGMVFSGTSPDNSLVEMVEIPDHPFYIACQFHPEFLSKPNRPHPLFKGFIAAAHERMHHKAL